MKTLRKRLISFLSVAVGGSTGEMISNKMDNQAKEIEKKVPDAKVERVGEGIAVEFSSNDLFGPDTSTLSNYAKLNVGKLVTILHSYADTDIEIQGHTDDKGTEAYNSFLSELRAGAVSGYLATKGISDDRVKIKGFGESMPKYDNRTEEGRSQNRRVEFLITANQKMKAEAEKDAAE